MSVTLRNQRTIPCMVAPARSTGCAPCSGPLTAICIKGLIAIHGNWQSTTTEQFTQALDAYIRWYNEKRIKMSLGEVLSFINTGLVQQGLLVKTGTVVDATIIAARSRWR
jgi:hypothetical protein